MSRYRYDRPFPFWVSGPVWAFLAMALVVGTGVLSLAGLGLNPDTLAAAVGVGLPLVPAAMFLIQDWRWHREDVRRARR